MNILTTIQLKFHNQAFADEAHAFIKTMIKAIFANGGKLLPFEDSCSLNVRYRHQYMKYRRQEKGYKEPVGAAGRLLSDLKQDGAYITLPDCDILQERSDMKGYN